MQVKSMVLPGETILAQESHYFPGGKGANQALACARSGGETCLVGKTGNDSNAELALSLLAESRCTLNISSLQEANTGLAIILLDSHGENSIIVSAGANAVWHESDEQIAALLSNTRILVLQLEIPITVVKRFLTIAKSLGIKTVLNPSPVSSEIREALPMVDLLLMNKTEAEYFTGKTVDDTPGYAQHIDSLGAGETVVTLGEQGALVFQAGNIEKVAAVKTQVIDTTAAGDTYAGALVARLSNGDDLLSAAQYASAASAIAVSKMGAQPSIPTDEEVASIINDCR